jgi:phosphate transport system permease protein
MAASSLSGSNSPEQDSGELSSASQGPIPVTRIRLRPPNRFADAIFLVFTLMCALSVLAIVALIVYELVVHSEITLRQFGLKFFSGTNWDPVAGDFGALPFIFGTLVSSAIALTFAVPLAVGVSVFTTEMCPRPLRLPIAFCTELLAAIPSVVYGLWAFYILVPALRIHVDPLLIRYLGWTGLFTVPDYGISIWSAGLVLAIMIIPIISSITREVMVSVPQNQREAVLALGATRWEMIRMGVLRNARSGIIGAMILGLGRALGETIAVSMVIGNNPQIVKSLLAPGHAMAGVIALEFSEAATPAYLSALVEIGLALFLVTIVVNSAARLLVWAVTHGMPARAHA